MAERHTIPARKGLALRVRKGQRYKVINTHGTQIVDHWAFNVADSSITIGVAVMILDMIGAGKHVSKTV